MKNVGVTPRGTAMYPHISKPDKTYGGYKVNLILSRIDAEKLIEATEAILDEACTAKKRELEGAKKIAKAKSLIRKSPFTDELDEDGNPTGNVIVKFKSIFPPIMRDCKAKELKKRINVFGGSQIKVAYEIKDYYIAKDNTVGVSFYLKGVQIIDLVSGGSMFNAEEGSFNSDEADDLPGESNDTTSTSEDDSETIPF